MVIVTAKRLSLLSDTLLVVMTRPTRFSLSINAIFVPISKNSGRMTRETPFEMSRMIPMREFKGTHKFVSTNCPVFGLNFKLILL